jgi:hypothetical protein
MSAPTSPRLPTRSAVCPACGASFALPATGRCRGCDVDLTHPALAQLLELEQRRKVLDEEHAMLLEVLTATGARPSPPSSWKRTDVAGAVAVPPPPPPTSGEWVPARRAPAPGAWTPPPDRAPHRSVPTLLAIAGVALLTTAAVVFTAVTWTTLPSWLQAVILLVATIVAGAAAFALQRRGIPTAAAGVGVVTMSFASVDVVGLDRVGLVDFDVFVVPVAAGLAALVGWWLARHDLRWVATAGASAAVVAAGSLGAALSDRYSLSLIMAGLVGIGCALLLAATFVAWPTRPARLVTAGAATFGVTLAGLAAAGALGGTGTSLPAGLGVVTLAIAVLLVAGRWTPLPLAPAAMLVTAAVAASAVHLGAQGLEVVAAIAVPVVASAWLAGLLAPRRRMTIVVGMAPAAVVLGLFSLQALSQFAARWMSTVLGGPGDLLELWSAVTVALVGAALLALPQLRAHVDWIGSAVVVVASAALPTDVAWPLLLALSTGITLTVPLAARPVLAGDSRVEWHRTDLLVPLLLAVVATGWAAGSNGTLAVAAGVTAAVGMLLAHRVEPVRQAEPVRCVAAEVVGVSAGALTVWAAAETFGMTADVALGAALVVVFALVVAVRALREATPPIAGSLVAATASVLVPGSADTLRAAGVLLLVVAVGWLALAIAGWRYTRWVSAVAVSAGIATLLADADVTVVEAYTLAPALALGAAGIWDLLEDRELRTIPALSPALVVALAPSLVDLALEPQALARTLGLVIVAGALAAVATRLRWLAPIVAAAVTAVVVALTQLSMVVEVAPRWATFAVVGVLLVYLAASYERQVARARTLGDRLSELR